MCLTLLSMIIWFSDSGPKSQTLLIFSPLLRCLLQLTLLENSKIISKHLNELLSECIIYNIIVLVVFREETVHFRLPIFLSSVPGRGDR